MKASLLCVCFLVGISRAWSVFTLGLLSNYTISCLGAKDTNFSTSSITGTSDNAFCQEIIHWTSANLFNNKAYSLYSHGDYLSIEEQDEVAANTAAELLGYARDPNNSRCIKAVKWYSCLQAFPYCPQVGYGMSGGGSYLPACEMHCEQVRDHCGLRSHSLLQCSTQSAKIDHSAAAKYAQNQHAMIWNENSNKNCLTYVPAGQRLLPPNRGSYDKLPLFYTIMMAFWSALALVWIIACQFGTKSANPRFSRAIALAILLRVGLAAVCRELWISCNEMTFYCSNSAVGGANAGFRIFEAGQIFFFFTLAKGWSITRPSLPTTDWFLIIIVTALFLFSTFTFGSIPSTAPSHAWIIFTCAIYGYVFSQFFALIWLELSELKGQLRKIDARMPEERVAPIRLKVEMFKKLALIGCLVIGLEFLCQVMFASQSVEVFSLSAVYEVLSFLIFVGITIVFRPRAWSPFFFMTPTTQHHREQHFNDLPRPLPIVSVQHSLFHKKDAEPADPAESTELVVSVDDDFELELAPLIPPVQRRNNSGNNNYSDKSMIVINRDDGYMSVGVRLVEDRPEDADIAGLGRFPLFNGGSPNRIVPL